MERAAGAPLANADVGVIHVVGGFSHNDLMGYLGGDSPRPTSSRISISGLVRLSSPPGEPPGGVSTFLT